MKTKLTPQFWQTVKFDFLANQSEDYICLCSEAFKTVWAAERAEILNLAGLFLSETKWGEIVKPADKEQGVLFEFNGNARGNERRESRLEFMDWNIKRF